MKKSNIAMLLVFFIGIPLTLFLGSKLVGRSYYITGTFIIIQLMIPFFMAFEGRKPQARELVVIAVLFCIIVLTGSLAPLVLKIHAGNAPAMMTMPLFVYCIFADFVLLEVIFLMFQPGMQGFFKESEAEQPTDKKKLSTRAIIGIVCCVLLLCSIVLAPNVCHVFTEQGVDSYVFFKTDSVAWEDIPLYELTFTQENGLELYALGNKKPLKTFDMLGFSLQYEMSYTNVLYMLDLAGIPLRSADRGAEYPIIQAGGPCACNAEPLADFIDIFLSINTPGPRP